MTQSWNHPKLEARTLFGDAISQPFSTIQGPQLIDHTPLMLPPEPGFTPPRYPFSAEVSREPSSPLFHLYRPGSDSPAPTLITKRRWRNPGPPQAEVERARAARSEPRLSSIARDPSPSTLPSQRGAHSTSKAFTQKRSGPGFLSLPYLLASSPISPRPTIRARSHPATTCPHQTNQRRWLP